MRPARLCRVMGHMDDRDPLLARQLRQQIGELVAAFGVHHGGGLVGDEQPGCPRERGRDRQALELPAGERGGFAVGDVREPDPLQQGLDIDRTAAVGQAPDDVVADAHTQYLRLRPLKDHGGSAGPAQCAVAGPQHLPVGGAPAADDPGEC